MPTSIQTIREIVSAQPSAAAILQRFDIDLCSHADESLKQACAELQLSVEQVLEKLTDAAAEEHGAKPIDPSSYSLSRLIQHIVRNHHQSVRRELPRLSEMAHKVAIKQGDRAPELKEAERLIDELRADMLAHLQKEEQALFPFIAEMDQEHAAAFSAPPTHFRAVTRPVSMMKREHDAAEKLVGEIRSVTHGFDAPDWACPTHVALFAGLRGFADDLRQHLRLENDLLFPRALELETELNHRVFDSLSLAAD